MEYAVEEKIRNELSVKERLVWCGRPKQGIMLRPSDAYLMPRSLISTGLAAFLAATFARELTPSFAWIWALPFLATGLYIVLGRFFVDAVQRGKTYYGVTAERIIIISGLINRRVKSLAIKTLGDISLTEKRNRQGTITSGAAIPWYRRPSFVGFPGTPEPTPSFEEIPNAQEVYDQIRRIQSE